MIGRSGWCLEMGYGDFQWCSEVGNSLGEKYSRVLLCGGTSYLVLNPARNDEWVRVHFHMREDHRGMYGHVLLFDGT